MITLGKKVQMLRIFKGLSQKELAQNLVSRSMITQIEGNKATPSTDLLIKILKKLDASTEEFLENLDLENMTGKGIFDLAKEFTEAGEYAAGKKLLSLIADTPNPIIHTFDFQFYMLLCMLYTGEINAATQELEHLIAAETHQEVLKAKVLYHIADAYFSVNNLDVAKLYARKSLVHLQAENHGEGKFLRARVNNLLGVVYSREGKYSESIMYYTNAFEDYAGNLEYGAGMLGNLGIEYKNLGEFDQAQTYFEKSLTLYKKLPLNKPGTLIKFNYGTFLSTIAQYHESSRILKASLEEFRTLNIDEMVPVVYSELAKLELKHGNIEAAMEFAQIGLQTSEEKHFERPYLFQIIGEIHLHSGAIDEAITMLEGAIPLFEEHSRLGDLLKALPLLSTCYERLGDVEKAVATLERSKVFMNI